MSLKRIKIALDAGTIFSEKTGWLPEAQTAVRSIAKRVSITIFIPLSHSAKLKIPSRQENKEVWNAPAIKAEILSKLEDTIRAEDILIIEGEKIKVYTSGNFDSIIHSQQEFLDDLQTYYSTADIKYIPLLFLCEKECGWDNLLHIFCSKDSIWLMEQLVNIQTTCLVSD